MKRFTGFLKETLIAIGSALVLVVFAFGTILRAIFFTAIGREPTR